jgi:hypothetical protein
MTWLLILADLSLILIENFVDRSLTFCFVGVRGGRAIHGASDVSESQAGNLCLCGVWVQSQLAALDMLHRIKGIFGADHIGGFLQALRFPPPSKGSYSPNVLGRRDTVAAVLSPGRVARISQGNL